MAEERWVENETTYAVDHSLDTTGARIEVRTYENVPCGKTVTFEARTSIGMVISANPIHARYPDGFGVTAYQNVGSLIFRPRGVPWEALTGGGRVRTMVCAFDDDWFNGLRGRDGAWQPSALKESLHLRNPMIAQSLRILEKEIRAPGFASDILTEATTVSMAIQLARHLTDRQPWMPAAEQVARLSDRQLRAIDACLAELSGKVPTVRDLAAACGLSSRHLLRRFKHTTGRTVSAHIADMQFTRARLLLAESTLPLKEISYRLGFACHSTFTRAFSRAAGESPSAFRRRHN